MSNSKHCPTNTKNQKTEGGLKYYLMNDTDSGYTLPTNADTNTNTNTNTSTPTTSSGAPLVRSKSAMRPTTHIVKGQHSFRLEYRTLDIPSDATNTPENRLNYIFYVASEAFPTYRMPSSTRVVWDDGNYVRVCRESNYVPQPKPNPNTHYIATAGIRGCIPQYSEVFTTKSAAAEALATIHDYAPRGGIYRLLMHDDGHSFINPQKAGNEYACIDECTCNNPEVHTESEFSHE